MEIGRFLKHLLYAMVMLAVLLIVLFWALNFIATKVGPLSGLATGTANLASGAAYGY
jgi:nitrogen fixation/metabolism regulation signal transduction histidine kinase